MNRLVLCALVPVAVRYPALLFRVLTVLVRVALFACGHVLPLLWLGIGAEALTVAVLLVLVARQLAPWPHLHMAAGTR